MYSFFFANRFLRSRKINLICVLGIALGVMTMTVVVSVMKGFGRELREQFRGMLSDVIVESGTTDGLSDPDQLLEAIRAIKHVKAVAPKVDTLAFVQCRGKIMWVRLVGVDPAAEAGVSRLNDYVKGGLNFGNEEVPGAIVGSELAATMGMYPGSNVTVFCLGADDTGLSTLKVLAKFKSGWFEYDSRFMYTSLKAARELTGMGENVSVISVALDDYAKHADAVVQKIWSVIGDRGYVTVHTWEDRRKGWLRAVEQEKNVMVVILAFIIIVAAFSITGTLSMMVIQKTRQIGIIKSMGATSCGITGIFLIEGFFMGVLGATIGTVGGLAFLSRINYIADKVEDWTGFSVYPESLYYFDRMPTDINPVTIAVTFLATVAISVVAAAYPALRAARLDPVEALRYE